MHVHFASLRNHDYEYSYLINYADHYQSGTYSLTGEYDRSPYWEKTERSAGLTFRSDAKSSRQAVENILTSDTAN